MDTKKKRKLGAFGGLLGFLLVTMTISDVYYGDLSEAYPLLLKEEFIEGTIMGIKVHHDHTYVELDTRENRQITPSYLVGHETARLSEYIAMGDHFAHEGDSDRITLTKEKETRSFLVSHLFAKK